MPPFVHITYLFPKSFSPIGPETPSKGFISFFFEIIVDVMLKFSETLMLLFIISTLSSISSSIVYSIVLMSRKPSSTSNINLYLSSSKLSKIQVSMQMSLKLIVCST